MKVLLYTEGEKMFSKSGLGKAIKHQMKALEEIKKTERRFLSESLTEIIESLAKASILGYIWICILRLE